MQEKLCENEKLMREMSLTWEEKLHKTEQLQVQYSSRGTVKPDRWGVVLASVVDPGIPIGSGSTHENIG